MSDPTNPELPDEMSEYLQMFLDETEEQLEDLVETLLILERQPDSKDELNESFRLIHSIKGSAGIMGFDNITVLTHHLENRFERFRSGLERLDQPMMNLVLRCIDFLKECTNRLRSGQNLGSAGELLEELREREKAELPPEPNPEAAEPTEPEQPLAPTEEKVIPSDSTSANVTVQVQFEPGLQLVDLKAQLIVSRLSGLGEVRSTQPPMADLESIPELSHFVIHLETTKSADSLRSVVDLDGVQSVEIQEHQTETTSDDHIEPTPIETPGESEPIEPTEADSQEESVDAVIPEPQVVETPIQVRQEVPTEAQKSPTIPVADQPTAKDEPGQSEEKPKARVAETLRVDIDRLDNLMNLAGELVVNRARFVQVSGLLSPELNKSNVVNRLRDLGESLKQIIGGLHDLDDVDGEWLQRIQDLESGLELVQEQTSVMETSRRCFGQITEAIDQLTRVSDKLQRGVLETRMVPVGPLFNRFKRVVRDLAVERGKKVNLELRGEKTELDKRMIDELGDPLVHLVRNSIDHGMEPPEVRAEQGKPEVGTIILEASHSGHNVYIHVRDDGAGINLDRIKAKIVDRGLLSFVAVEDLSREEIIDYIWHPGFSTAESITDVSGRGVGMDVVKTRVNDLNGTIEVDSNPQQGTTFTIRLPLTLAIINSLLVRARGVIFSIPISDVREIVAIQPSEIVSIHGRETFDVRGEFIPLVSINDVFTWQDSAFRHEKNGTPDSQASDTGSAVHVVILQTVGRTLGLRVEELLGGQEIVIKSLSDNFVSIRGLSGASILGDGTVCLMLDVAAVIDQAIQVARQRSERKEVYVGSTE